MAVRQWMSRALWLISLAGAATGCVDDGVSLHVICPAAPTVEESSCSWEAGGEACVAEGVLNISSTANYTPNYRLNLRVESGLKPRARDVPPRSEPNGLQMAWANVELRLPTGEAINFQDTNALTGAMEGPKNPFHVTASGYIAPGGSIIVPLNVITSEHVRVLQAKALVPQIVAAVQLHGTTNGAEEVESAEYSWPIRLINVSTNAALNECIPGIGYCLSARQQDSFAEACTSNSAN